MALSACVSNNPQQPEKPPATTSAPSEPSTVVAPVNTTLANQNKAVEKTLAPKVVAKAPLKHTDVWQRIKAQLSIKIPQNRPVVKARKAYAKHPAFLPRIAKRAEPYLFYIVEEVQKRNMPIEIALLPIVESEFDPFGYSHRSASGIWQFMPQTGKRFNLQQNWWYDGRRDIVRSTQAALDYLTYLHKFLGGDWLNAIAAYNSGEGRVLNAIKKNRKKGLPIDFWSLSLPKETTVYVPKLLAIADLLKRADKFKVKWNAIANKKVVEQVDIGSQIDLTLAADMADISLAHLYRLNPGFNRWATAPNGPHTLLIPVEKAANFKARLAKTDAKSRLQWQRYTVKRGDSLSVIAKKYGTSAKALRDLNKLKSNTIRIKQTLLIPASKGQTTTLPKAVQIAAKKATKRGKTSKTFTKNHVISRGDTLWDLSRQYDVTVAQLQKWNNIKTNKPLKLGKKIQIKLPIDDKNRTITYQVKRGDSLARIANKFSLRIKDIVRWNNLSGKKYLQPGQKLRLKVRV